jgi:hypothetical protein
MRWILLDSKKKQKDGSGFILIHLFKKKRQKDGSGLVDWWIHLLTSKYFLNDLK